MRKAILLLTFILLPLFACLSPQKTSQGDEPLQAKTGLTEKELVRTSPGEAITVDVIFLNPLTKDENDLVFMVYINTHTVDLAGYDIEQLATFRNSEGLEISDGFTWITRRDSPHHRSGFLKLPLKPGYGPPLITKKTEYITLEIEGIEAPRTFRWGKETLRYMWQD